MSEIAENLKRLMDHEGINTTELSKKTGVEQSVLHRILTGTTKNPSIKSITPILEYFSIGLDEINSIENEKWLKGEVPIISWEDATNTPLKSTIKSQKKFIKTNKKISDVSFALLIEYDIDSRFPKGTLLIVCPEVPPKNRSYVIIQEDSSKLASLRHYIVDGNTAYLKPIDTALPTQRYNDKVFRIVGVVVQYIFDFE
jgi:SOS-response transcriptional repressor LexA